MMLALYVFYRIEIDKRPIWNYSILGVCSGLLFLLKPTLIGIPLSIFVALAISEKHANSFFLRKLFLALLGIAIPLVLVGIYLYATHALSAFIDQVVFFNHAYMQHAPLGFFDSLAYGLTSTASVTLFACIGCIVACVRWKQIAQHKPYQLFLLVALIDFPIEVVLSSLPGRAYIQYYVSWLPSLLILSCFLFASLFSFIHTLAKRHRTYTVEISRLVDVVSIVILSSSIFPLLLLFHYYYYYRSVDLAYAQVVTFIDTHTTPRDYVLFWGYQTNLNYASHRQSPTKFTYQTGLFMKGYQTPALFDTIYTELHRSSPRYIIDTSPNDLSCTDQSDDSLRRYPPSSPAKCLPEMQRILQFVHTDYSFVGTIGVQKWLIYKRIAER